MTRPPCWALVLAMALIPEVAGAITLLGSPPTLSPGQVKSLPFTLFGEQVTPRLDLNGSIRYQTLGMRLDDEAVGLMVPELNLDFNLQLTATQRVHALFRPLERGFRKPTFHQFAPENTGWTVQASGEPARLWYEGQPLNWLTPRDEFPLDISVAGGRLPLAFHNEIWFNNTFDGLAISKNNIQVATVSNLNLIYFLTRGQTQGGLTAVERREARKNVMGLVGFVDWLEYYWQLSWARSYDNERTAAFPEDLDRDFWGLSITRTFGFAGLALRALGSSASASRDAGALFVLEAEKELLGVRGYATVFGGTEDWLPVSQEGSALARLGVLFTFDRLTPFPGLTPRGADSMGGVLGVIFNPRGTVTVTPEVGWLIDTSSQHDDQVGAAVLIQADVAKLLIPGETLEATRRRGLLYGLLARVTGIAVHHRNAGPARDTRDDYGGRLELVYKF